MNKNDVITDPKKLVRQELANKGIDIDSIKIPQKVYILADSLYDAMLERNCSEYKYPIGGSLHVFKNDESVGFIKGVMCSPAMATQAEDLIAGGVKELIHIGFAGGLQSDMQPGEIILTDGAYNDTAVARLYGFDYDIIESTASLTNQMEALLLDSSVKIRRGKHWTTDAGYMETWGQVLEHSELGALCVEMEGVGLFTVANYRKCSATGVYIISDVLTENDWKLGWSEDNISQAIEKLINAIISK